MPEVSAARREVRKIKAPLDTGALEDALRPFGESRMLPRAAYTDPAVLEWERRHFFGGGWMALHDGAATMSLDGASGGVPLRGRVRRRTAGRAGR